MGREEEPEPSSTPKLPLLSLPPIESYERSGTLTPPLQTSASVPFRWEDEPGKPRPCTVLISATTTNKGLELPPRLQSMNSKMTKIPSPTTVLEGPDLPLFQSSSFRFTRERQGSFGSSCGSPEGGQFGNYVVLSKSLESKGKGLFGSWSWRRKPTLKRGKKDDIVGGSFVFSSSTDLVDFGGDESGSAKGKKMARVGRNGSFSRLSQVRPHFWATIYEGFKQLLPWKRAKSKKDGLII